MVLTIPLSKQGKNAGKYVAIVDDTDDWVLGHRWSVIGGRSKYAKRFPFIYLHREIMARVLGRELTSNEEVDHINGNKMDNTRGNLRIATRSQNAANVKPYANNKTGFKGVQKDGNRYRASVSYDKRRIYIGSFKTPEEAHAAYCEKAKELFGEFANSGTD